MPDHTSGLVECAGGAGDRLKVLVVSVDSERDTPAALASYMGSFDRRITAVTGKADDTARAARTFNAFHQNAGSSDGAHTFDHTTDVQLIGRDGRRGSGQPAHA